ncbi:hypothetical protein [Sphingomonas sp. SAFR-052]|uniref:hypothetical protein n=1 Tax=Sphingomonas sp. SAFR-052 TaxID=3436867 RepID=UPI003F7D25BD
MSALHPVFAGILSAHIHSATVADRYRDWAISFDYPPIPCRDFDWSATHPDYDGADDANDNRIVHGRTRDDVIAAIDAWFEEHSA